MAVDRSHVSRDNPFDRRDIDALLDGVGHVFEVAVDVDIPIPSVGAVTEQREKRGPEAVVREGCMEGGSENQPVMVVAQDA